jgi:DNA repair protein RecN (Recombination protein N)
MLHELDIESYAVVERLRIPFHAGLNILTGETGSGKSIMVGSLALLLGARASVDVVRAGTRKARVSARFDFPRDRAAVARLSASGIDCEGDELIVERQVLASGKSRAYLNGSPVTVGLLRDLAPHLGDIHGQHEQQTLVSPALQLRLLDSFIGCARDVDALGTIHRRWRASDQALGRLRGNEQERLRRIDLLRYQVAEIRDTAPQLDEDEELDGERARLANVERLRQCGFEAYGALYDSNSSASSLIKSAADSLASVGSVDDRFDQFAKSLEDARSTVDDVAFELRAYLEKLEADPDRLEAVEDRLSALDKLKRKYGPSLQDVLEFAERSTKELALLNRSDAEIERLESEVAAAGAEYARRAGALSRKRALGAERLAARTEGELRDLALARSRFVIGLKNTRSPAANGLDRAALLFSANPGQPLRPLGQVASGGELSRVALALKTCLEQTVDAGLYRRTLVFDEIDSGVGGSVAEAIGRRLQRLSAVNQVLCVTHLPQIACLADAHFHVSKTETGDSTAAAVVELSVAERVEEVARMLSGAEVTAAALENARQLLRDR